MGLFGPSRATTQAADRVTRALQEQRTQKEREDAAEKRRNQQANPKCRADKTVLRDKPGKRR